MKVQRENWINTSILQLLMQTPPLLSDVPSPYDSVFQSQSEWFVRNHNVHNQHSLISQLSNQLRHTYTHSWTSLSNHISHYKDLPLLYQFLMELLLHTRREKIREVHTRRIYAHDVARFTLLRRLNISGRRHNCQYKWYRPCVIKHSVLPVPVYV